ncbi:unnamed protein product [Sphagnum jensenii]
MISQSKRQLEAWDLKPQNVHLVSGGAAWSGDCLSMFPPCTLTSLAVMYSASDHVAVALFLQGEADRLTLHLPCPFIRTVGKEGFKDSGKKDWRSNPGRTANIYHVQFSQALGRSSTREIALSIDRGATVVTHAGFHARNCLVAKSSFLIAFSWGAGEAPDDGGTKDTWDKCPASTTRKHFSLHQLQ